MANHTATHCPHGHPTPTATARTAQGFCRKCKRLNDARRHHRNREAVELVRALEAITPEELAERIKALG
ncbi:hypothetical protein [Mycobacterium noviomagense]|uniref:HNH endonuclease n=1 Tax=Mycobacterium noviomagense TaxID=459858 RepID=A0A7I7PBM8_9MYCO|nr:hypothetical protein [Mycobacterium noviomagense]ORB11635.1 hypothetical protein BST37_18710 [Mycobacterium noviomagense]BBY06020.1 hypothetical protein MNVI_13380 [Mycobacterium noviomagense]